MNKFAALTKIELVKQLKKISIVAIIILVVISAFIAPIAKKMIDTKFKEQDYSQLYKSQIEYIDYSLKDIGQSDSQSNKLRRQSLQTEKEMYERLIKENVGMDSWIYDNNYKLLLKTEEVIALQALVDGYSSEVVAQNSYTEVSEAIRPYLEAPKEEIQNKLESTKKLQVVLKESVESNDYFKYLSDIIASDEKIIELQKKKITQVEGAIKISEEKKNTKELDELKSMLSDIKIDLGKAEELLKVNKYKYDNKIKYDKNEWKSNTLKNIEELVSQRKEKVLGEDEFKQQYALDIARGLTYNKYKENIKANLDKVNLEIEKNWYSLNNNIPQMEFSNDARNSVSNIYLSFTSVAVVIGIIIAGGIVSSEFSKGTIRLLMIRPVLRWKILLSKLTTALLISYSIIIASFIAIILSSGVMYGFGGFSNKILIYSNGSIIERGFFIITIGKLLFSSISLIFAISFAFAISTLVKNTALAVALPIIAYMASLPLTMILLGLNMKWVVKTVIPYMNLSTYESKSFYVDMFKQQFGVTVNPNIGAIQLVVISILFLILAFIVFNKRDVSN